MKMVLYQSEPIQTLSTQLSLPEFIGFSSASLNQVVWVMALFKFLGAQHCQ